MNKKMLIIIAVVALVAGGAGYKFVLAKPKKAEPKAKVDGTVYVLGKEFLVNLTDGRFAKLTVALVLSPKDTSSEAAGGEHAAKPTEGFGTMAQEAVVRDIITDELTDAKDTDLIDRKGRTKLKKEILTAIDHRTDVQADGILFTDMTVQ
jgi:flagellar basal body-associated protein FliL